MKKCLAVILMITFLFSIQAVPLRAAPAGAKLNDIQAVIDSNKLVTIRGTLSSGQGQVVTVRILDPNGNLEYANSTVTTSWGGFQFTYTMKNNTAGFYDVALNALGLAEPVTTIFQYGVNNDLMDLAVSDGGLDKTFSPAITEYAVNVDCWVSNMSVTPMVSDSTASVRVNDKVVISGMPSEPIPLKEGDNEIKVTVTALTTESKTYTITVTRPKALSAIIQAKAGVNTDKKVKITGFASSGAGRQISVMVTDPQGNIDYLGTTTSTGSGNFECSYTMSNTMTGRYTVLLGTLGLASPVTAYFDYVYGVELKNLFLSNGSLSPSFQPDVTSYAATVSGNVSSILVTPTAGGGSGKILANKLEVPSGQSSAPLTLYHGETTINIEVLAQDGTAGKSYTLTVTRLIDLPAAVTLRAQIDKNKLVTVSGTIGTTALQPISIMITDPKGRLEYVNSTQTADGGVYHFAYTMFNTTKGRYDVTIGTVGLTMPIKTYFIYNLDCADLKELSIDNEMITAQFAPDQTQYSATVESSAVRLSAAAEDPEAAIQINNMEVVQGSVSGYVNLTIGDNTVKLAVTATNGTIKNYFINIHRLPPPLPQPPTPQDDSESDEESPSYETPDKPMPPGLDG